jgi:hypothetical protein
MTGAVLIAACLRTAAAAAAPVAGQWLLSVEVASSAGKYASQGQFCLAGAAAAAGQIAMRPIMEAALDLHARQQGQADGKRNCSYVAGSPAAAGLRWQVSCQTPLGEVAGQGKGRIGAATLRLQQTVKLRGNTTLPAVMHTVTGRRVGDCRDNGEVKVMPVHDAGTQQRRFMQIHRACCGRYPAMNQLGASNQPPSASRWLM